MPFPSGPVLHYIGSGLYKTVGVTEYVGERDRITIPSDFVTDLASVPRIFWALMPPTGVYERAAVLHDLLCTQLAKRTCLISSRDADGLFRRVAREGGAGFVTRWILWTGVRWGALFNPARRSGWWRDAAWVLLISALVVAAFVLVLLLLGVAALSFVLKLGD